MADKPMNFPGVRDFIVREGVSPNWQGRIGSDWFLNRAIDAAAQIPAAAPATREAHFRTIDAAEQALLNTLDTLRKVREWSKHNIETEPTEMDSPSDLRPIRSRKS